MSEPTPSSQPAPAAGTGTGAAPTPPSTSTPPNKPSPPPRPQNPVFRMMGLPRLPSKLPSRNWLIFWTVTTSFAGAIIYDKREKNRATAKWRRAVAPLAEEKLASPNQLPRKLTIYLESPPGDGLRVAQNHFVEYVKPVLAASGLDWEFVQGRQQGDVRAAVAEKIRQARKKTERPDEELVSTDEASLEALRKKMGLPEYEGIKGDIVIGRHTWKEYIRGLHEGWLGPLDPPPRPVVELLPAVPEATAPQDGVDANSDSEKKESEEKEKEKEKEKKPDRPPQPVPHNKPEDYQSAILPAAIPAEFSPSTTIPFPHRLGFVHTFVRLGWFLNRRKLADDIGREVAAVCYATSRDYTTTEEDGGRQYEQQTILDREETDWPKSVWKPEVPAEDDTDKQSPTAPKPAKELVWTNPMVVDPRVADRMRRFQITPEHEAIAAQVKVPEEEIEGWIKGSLRSLWRWGASSFESKPQGPNVGNLNDE